MKPLVSMRRALSDPQLLGNAIAGDSWHAWRVLLIAAMGEALTDAERETFAKLTRLPLKLSAVLGLPKPAEGRHG